MQEEETDTQTNERRQQDTEHITSLREAESKIERYFRNYSQNGAARWRRRFFQGGYFCPDYYLDIGKMNSDCAYCDALHFFDEKVNSSTLLRPSFSIFCQH